VKIKTLAMAGILVLFSATFGLTQLMPKGVRVNIPFQFAVGSKVLPAGPYDFSRADLDAAIQVVSTQGGQSSSVVVVTRLGGEIHASPQDAHIVFDKVGDKYVFSELWLPDMDGFLLNVTKDKHEHHSIKVSR
jgi:hypothetical protein